MKPYLVDTHCHLDLFENIQNNSTLENATEIKTISVTNAPQFFKANADLFRNQNNIRIALGLHPQLVNQYFNELELLEQEISQTRYIGEIGLDGSSDLTSTFELQVKVLEQILKICNKEGGKILTIHSRNAAKEIMQLLPLHIDSSSNKIILHWYSGGLNELRSAVEKGYFFSINHKMVESGKGREILKNIPESHLLTETDAPFTFNKNISSRIQSLGKTMTSIAEIKNRAYDEVIHIIWENFRRLLKA